MKEKEVKNNSFEMRFNRFVVAFAEVWCIPAAYYSDKLKKSGTTTEHTVFQNIFAVFHSVYQVLCIFAVMLLPVSLMTITKGKWENIYICLLPLFILGNLLYYLTAAAVNHLAYIAKKQLKSNELNCQKIILEIDQILEEWKTQPDKSNLIGHDTLGALNGLSNTSKDHNDSNCTCLSLGNDS